MSTSQSRSLRRPGGFPWRVAALSLLAVGAAHLLVRLVLASAGEPRPSSALVDLGVGLVLGAGAALAVWRIARRAGEQARPFSVLLLVWAAVFVLGRAIDYLNGRS